MCDKCGPDSEWWGEINERIPVFAHRQHPMLFLVYFMAAQRWELKFCGLSLSKIPPVTRLKGVGRENMRAIFDEANAVVRRWAIEGL